MFPLAITIPLFTSNTAVISTDGGGGNGSDRGTSSSSGGMELDFDLLAEYLLEDSSAVGFDFSSDPTTASAATATETYASQSPAPRSERESGVVTPHQADESFADPLADAVERLRRGGSVYGEGDLAGKLAQAQRTLPSRPAAPLQHPQLRPLAPPASAPPLAMPPTSLAAPLAPSVPMPPLRRPAQAPPPASKRPRPCVSDGGVATTVSAVVSIAAAATTAPSPSHLTAAPGRPPYVPAAAPHRYGTAPRPAAHGSAGAATVAAQSARVHAHPAAPHAALGPHHTSQAQIAHRRERNRILARRTRLRKKFFFDSLRKDVADLLRENATLKSIARSRLSPADVRTLLSTCDAEERLPSIIYDPIDGDGGKNGEGKIGVAGGVDVKQLDKEDFSLIKSIQNTQQSFVITDHHLHDNPIVYASDDFLKLTGYAQKEVLGRNCRFLQGSGTCPEAIATVRKAVAAGEDVNITMVNYTADGTAFWNSLFIAALRDAQNNVVNFIAVVAKVDSPLGKELPKKGSPGVESNANGEERSSDDGQ